MPYKRLLTILGILTFNLTAHATPEALQHGLSQTDVLSLLGAPLDKVRREVKREDIWEYKSVSLTFIDGALQRWKRSDEDSNLNQEAASTAESAPSRHTPQSITFSELFKSIPDDSGTQQLGGQPYIGAGAIQPMMDNPPTNLPPPIPPQAFNTTNPGMNSLLERLKQQSGVLPQPLP